MGPFARAGVLHFLGANGLPQLLAQRGCLVERVYRAPLVRPGAAVQCLIMPSDRLTRSPLRKSGVVSWVITWVLPSSMRRVTR